MSYLKELIGEIKKNHKSSLLFSELSKYRARYMDYYDKNVSAHPRSGFFRCMGWDAERRNEFHKEFDKLKFKVIEEEVKPAAEVPAELPSQNTEVKEKSDNAPTA